MDNLTLVTLLTINSLTFKHDVNPFSMLISDNIHVLYAYKLKRLTKSAGAGTVFSYPMVIPIFFSFQLVGRGWKVIIYANEL